MGTVATFRLPEPTTSQRYQAEVERLHDLQESLNLERASLARLCQTLDACRRRIGQGEDGCEHFRGAASRQIAAAEARIATLDRLVAEQENTLRGLHWDARRALVARG